MTTVFLPLMDLLSKDLRLALINLYVQ